MIGHAMTWRGFLSRNKQNVGARLLTAIGGDSPRETMAAIERSLVQRDIDGTSYSVRTQTLEEWRDKYVKGKPIVRELDPSDWHHLGNGAHMRKTHLGSHGGQ